MPDSYTDYKTVVQYPADMEHPAGTEPRELPAGPDQRLATERALIHAAAGATTAQVWRRRWTPGEWEPADRMDWDGATVDTNARPVNVVHSYQVGGIQAERVEAEAARRGINPLQLIEELIDAGLAVAEPG